MITLAKVSKVFDHRGIAGIHQLSLSIPKGKILALMGPNGSGKTTLLNLIAGKLPLDSGSLQVVGEVHFFERRKFERDLNVQKFLIESVKHDIDVEKKLQLSRDMADIFEFTFQLRQNLGQLSQGQLQKVLVAAELISRPDILFLDEPFIHLDPMTRKEILESMFNYLRQNEITVIWITHEKDEALRFSDLLALLQHGRLEQVGDPFSLLSSPKNLFVAQFFGQRNFFKVSRSSDRWITPWGPIESSLTGSEAYLVVPPNSWVLDPDSPFDCEILRIFPKNFDCELEVTNSEKSYLVSLPLLTYQDWKIGKGIKLSPNLEHCFLVPL